MPLKNIMVLLFIIIMGLLFVILNNDNEPKEFAQNKRVILSTFALYDAAKRISKDTLELSTVLPFGSDTHTYELTPKKMAEIQTAALFVYSGASLEPWIDKVKPKNAINMSQYMDLINFEQGQHCDHEGHGHNHHNHHNTHNETTKNIDPHYWLDLDNMVKIANKLTEAFIKISPEKKSFFELNKQAYIEHLKKMDTRYALALKECTKDTIVVNHNAYSYLGKKYGFQIDSINGLSTESMPSPQNIKNILHLIKEKEISVIFFESFASDRLVKSIAKDTNISVDTLQPLGNITKDEVDLSYEELMDKNIEKIKQALECK